VVFLLVSNIDNIGDNVKGDNNHTYDNRIFAFLYAEKDYKEGLKMLIKPISILIMIASIYYAYHFITTIVGVDDFIKTLTYASGRKQLVRQASIYR